MAVLASCSTAGLQLTVGGFLCGHPSANTPGLGVVVFLLGHGQWKPYEDLDFW